MNKVTPFTRHGLAVLSIVAVSVIAYLPAVDNSFISDDFGVFPFLKALEQNPLYILDAASELFRLMSYLYLWGCFKTFGLISEPYYWSGIALHAIVSLLVYSLALKITNRSLGAWAAAVFFAAYERHQEAVMWISAVNETILTLNCILFLLLWERATDRTSGTRMNMLVSLVMFVLALFSKEAAVVLVPLAMLSLVVRGYSPRQIFRISLPLLVMLVAFVSLWLSQAHKNFFVTGGHYAFGLHFLPVYTRSLIRLLSQTVPFVVALGVMKRRRAEPEAPTSQLSTNSSVLFFAAFLVLAIAPYSFLTYLNHIPSRNTYLSSVGLAGLIGILFAAMYDRLPSERSKVMGVLFLSAVVSGNIAYIWVKKEPQYRERAAPTRELIEILNGQGFRDTQPFPVQVCGFPLHPSVFSEAVSRFTRFNGNEVVLSDRCGDRQGAAMLRWDETTARYIVSFDSHREGPGENGSAVYGR